MDSIEPSRNFKTLRVYLSTSKHSGYLRFDIKGTYDFEDFKRALRLMRDTCVERRTPCALVDMLAMGGHIPDFDRVNLGIQFSEIWGTELRVAGILPPEKLNRLLERTAASRDAKVRGFTQEAPALEWLLEPWTHLQGG